MLADFQEEVRQELESTNPRACEKLCESAGNMVWKFDDFDLKTEKAGQEGYDKLLSKAKRIRDSLRIELEEAQAERDKLSQLNDAAMEENAALKQEIDRLRQQLADARAAQAAVGPATTFQVAPPSAPPPLRQTTLSVNLPNQAAKL
jgi:chromosome segregation ATPase